MKIRYSLIILSLLSLSYTNRYREAISLQINSLATAAACPILDDSHMAIEPSTCNGSDGGISSILVTGTTGMVRYIWYDLNNKEVSESQDLTGVPTGYYRVEVRDESKCPITKSIYYLVGIKNAVTIDNAKTVITTPTCNGQDGSITRVNAVNATQYQWTDQNNIILSTTKDLTNVAAGTYTLTASNITGCSSTYVYTITNGLYAPVLSYLNAPDADCNSTSAFTATFNMKPTDPLYLYNIYNAQNKPIASGAIAYNPVDSTRITADLDAGTYRFTANGPLNCEVTIATFTVGQKDYVIDLSKVTIHPDICGQARGTIVGIDFKGGIIPDARKINGYVWTNSAGKRVGSLKYLSAVPAGRYYLKATNKFGCSVSAQFDIPDSVSAVFTPIVNDVNLCLSGTAVLSVTNANPNAVYHLYDSTQTLLATNKNGYFTPLVTNTKSFYISAKSGICESPQTRVRVNVAAPGVIIPNAFTPNGDGINDYWEITGLEKLPGTEIKVFNRQGGLVYHAINYNRPFNGKYNGRDLPSGVYYYVIDTQKTICKGGISGSLTLIR